MNSLVSISQFATAEQVRACWDILCTSLIRVPRYSEALGCSHYVARQVEHAMFSAWSAPRSMPLQSDLTMQMIRQIRDHKFWAIEQCCLHRWVSRIQLRKVSMWLDKPYGLAKTRSWLDVSPGRARQIHDVMRQALESGVCDMEQLEQQVLNTKVPVFPAVPDHIQTAEEWWKEFTVVVTPQELLSELLESLAVHLARAVAGSDPVWLVYDYLRHTYDDDLHYSWAERLWECLGEGKMLEGEIYPTYDDIDDEAGTLVYEGVGCSRLPGTR